MIDAKQSYRECYRIYRLREQISPSLYGKVEHSYDCMLRDGLYAHPRQIMHHAFDSLLNRDKVDPLIMRGDIRRFHKFMSGFDRAGGE